MTETGDEFWMRQAFSLAESAGHLNEVPVGALVVKNGRLIGTGINLREREKQAVMHAEMLAIQQASRWLNAWRLSDCTLYVTLEPCLMCAGAIYQARLPRVVYGAKDPKGGALGSLYAVHEDHRLNHRFAVSSGVLHDESSRILSLFFQRRRSENKKSDPEKTS
jgi:tRNA(adenine34) deaminase